MQSQKKANSPKHSKAKAGSTQPNVVIPKIQRPSEILKEMNEKDELRLYSEQMIEEIEFSMIMAKLQCPIVHFSKSKRGEAAQEQIKKLLWAIDQFKNSEENEDAVAILYRMQNTFIEQESERGMIDAEKMEYYTKPIQAIVQLLVAINVHRDERVLPA